MAFKTYLFFVFFLGSLEERAYILRKYTILNVNSDQNRRILFHFPMKSFLKGFLHARIAQSSWSN